jgi:hypothetical protein
VGSIERDSRGYIWFGGFYKLQRFDGITIHEYKIHRYEAKGTSSGGGSLIFEDSDDNLWVFCNGFILLYDPLYDDFQYFKLQLPNSKNLIPKVVAVCEDSEQRLWIGFDGDLQHLLIRVPIKALLADKNENNDNPVLVSANLFDQFPVDFAGVYCSPN